MQVETTPSAEIVIRALTEDDRQQVDAWLQHLKNWSDNSFAKLRTKKLAKGDLYVLKATTDLRIYFHIDEANQSITVVDVAKHSVLGTAV
jgi:mRNA-degrading endonuclease RelE of RelBE toxin-antitoxin system